MAFQLHTTRAHFMLQAEQRAIWVCTLRMRTNIFDYNDCITILRVEEQNIVGEHANRNKHTTYQLQHNESPHVSYLEHYPWPANQIKQTNVHESYSTGAYTVRLILYPTKCLCVAQ